MAMIIDYMRCPGSCPWSIETHLLLNILCFLAALLLGCLIFWREHRSKEQKKRFYKFFLTLAAIAIFQPIIWANFFAYKNFNYYLTTAQHGDTGAQILVAIAYNEGRYGGVNFTSNKQEAYFWLSVSCNVKPVSDNYCIVLRRQLATKLTPEKLGELKTRIHNWKPVTDIH